MNGVTWKATFMPFQQYIGAFGRRSGLRSLIHSRPEAWMCGENSPSGKPTGSAGRRHRRGQSSRWQARAG
jgi:hypothetical protein